MDEKDMKFKPGDKVKLKLAGGPDMIVEGYHWDNYEYKFTDKVYCVWHNLLQNHQRENYILKMA